MSTIHDDDKITNPAKETQPNNTQSIIVTDEDPEIVSEEGAYPPVITERKFANHFKSYPVVNDSYEAIMSVPFLRKAHEASKPTKTAIMATHPIKFVVDTADRKGEYCLNALDSHFPSLMSLETDDLTRPITQPLGAIHLAVLKSVIEPMAGKFNRMSAYFRSVTVSEDGPSIPTAMMNHVVSPVNSALEKGVDRAFPGRPKAPEHSCELTKSFYIVCKAFRKRDAAKMLEAQDSQQVNDKAIAVNSTEITKPLDRKSTEQPPVANVSKASDSEETEDVSDEQTADHTRIKSE